MIKFSVSELKYMETIIEGLDSFVIWFAQGLSETKYYSRYPNLNTSAYWSGRKKLTNNDPDSITQDEWNAINAFIVATEDFQTRAGLPYAAAETRRLYREILLPRSNIKIKACFIATTVYGSYDAPEVQFLRKYT